MKKILLITTLIGFIFANTGMLTSKEEPGMGAWLSYEIATLDSDVDDFKGDFNIGFDYMTTIGLEVALNMGETNSNAWKGLELTYHYKMEKWNVGLSWSRDLFDDFEENDEDKLWFTGYSNNALYGGFGGLSVNGNDFEFDLIQVGKIWTFEMGASVGVSYEASFGSDAGIDKGILAVDLGYTF